MVSLDATPAHRPDHPYRLPPTIRINYAPAQTGAGSRYRSKSGNGAVELAKSARHGDNAAVLQREVTRVRGAVAAAVVAVDPSSTDATAAMQSHLVLVGDREVSDVGHAERRAEVQ